MGLAFDGSTFYYTIRVEPVPGTYLHTYHRLDLASESYLGGVVATENGNPITPVAGLEYDSNRGVLWCGSARSVVAVNPGTGVKTGWIYSDNPGSWAVAYDPTRDLVIESSAAAHSTKAWYAGDGTPGGTFAGLGDQGLTFDGYDLWRFSASTLPPPAPQVPGVLFPCDMSNRKDLTRLIDPPGLEYRDLAFDCVTFPVPVVWVANNIACEVIAYEVETRGPCLEPGDRLLRATASPQALPLLTPAAQFIWQVQPGFVHRDDGLIEDLSLSYYYRLLGPGDADRGNVLRAVKDMSTRAVVVSAP